MFLSDKLPQPNYEKIGKKNHSFTKKIQNDLPDLNIRNNLSQNNTIIPTTKSNDNSHSSNNQTEAIKSSSLKKKNSNNISNTNKEIIINASNNNEKLTTIAENTKENVRQQREKSPKVLQKEMVIHNSPIKRIEYPEDSAASNVHNNRRSLSPSQNLEINELPQIKIINKR